MNNTQDCKIITSDIPEVDAEGKPILIRKWLFHKIHMHFSKQSYYAKFNFYIRMIFRSHG